MKLSFQTHENAARRRAELEQKYLDEYRKADQRHVDDPRCPRMGDCPGCGSGVGTAEGTVCGECDAEMTPADRLDAKLSGRDSNTAFHQEEGKPMVDQVPPDFILEVAKVFTYGARKYGAHNWQEHASEWTWNQLYASALRHLLAWQAKEDFDPESGLMHLAHAACNIGMLITLIKHGLGQDDRGPIYGSPNPNQALLDAIYDYNERHREPEE